MINVFRVEFYETDLKMLEIWIDENMLLAIDRYERVQASVKINVIK